MGFAKFLGRDCGITYTPQLRAFECFIWWTLTGWIISFGLSMLFIQPPNLVIPALFYLFGICFLFGRYLRLDKKGLKNDSK